MADFPNEIRINPAVMNKLILGGVVVVLVGMGVMSSFYKVDPREHAIVLRLGKYTGAPVTEQGLHFKLPFGIDRVTNVEVTTVHKLEFGYTMLADGTRTRTRQQAESSLIVTGDLNVADVQWSTQYMISDPPGQEAGQAAYNYLFKVRNADDTFRDMNEAVMREVVGDRTINEVLTAGRSEIEQEVKEELQRLANQYELGIELDKVILQDVFPPESVKQSWDDVSQADQERSEMINKAQADYNKVIPKSRGEADRTIEEAKGYAVERVNNAQGDANLFKQVFSAYQKAPEITRKRIYLETIGKVLATQQRDDGNGAFIVEQGPRKIIMDEDAKGLLPLLNLNQEVK
ncbi:MAG: FtsH protease activity modulator HflK [Verrucomicrobiota bacterium]|jgi:membrane protease subunit HflK|nr:FtsH protease activity modulator HflK [Verrucomicrobiota bacterium]